MLNTCFLREFFETILSLGIQRFYKGSANGRSKQETQRQDSKAKEENPGVSLAGHRRQSPLAIQEHRRMAEHPSDHASHYENS
jgi:hypothetical protein